MKKAKEILKSLKLRPTSQRIAITEILIKKKDVHVTAYLLKKMLAEVNIEVLADATTHIVPVMVRDPKKCKLMSDMLLDDYNIYIQPINYPTVARGTERLRIAPTPLHTDAMMHDLVEALRKTFKRVSEGK